MSHTPGPWTVERNHNGNVFGVMGSSPKHDLDLVCQIENEKDAVLIAESPEMLYILQGIAAVVAPESHWGQKIKQVLDRIESTSATSTERNTDQ